MGQTITEKILSCHAGKMLYADDLAIVKVQGTMASDTTAPYAIKAFKDMGGERVFNNRRCIFVIDHAAPAPNQTIASLHKLMREFAREKDLILYEMGEGICHQLVIEKDHVRPGEVFIGADSHTCTYGALNAFATGVGSTDLAAVMLTGKIWLKVPKTIKIVYHGQLQKGVSAKDLILFTAGKLGIDGATYQTIEYHGEAVRNMTVSSRMILANMAIEMGAKAGMVSPEGLNLPYEFLPTYADADAQYSKVLEFDISNLKPQISFPHSPDNVHDIDKALGKPVQFAFIGTCTNGRLEDLHDAARILRGKRIHQDVRLLIAPASKQVFLDAIMDGTAQVLLQAGATFLPSGCGPCVGTHLGVPGDAETVISAANRNFRGRMGNPNAEVYLSSAATVAASALAGCIAVEEQGNL
jgi:3-isopropylmalate/(R)-2-methylmalate dehydratase large subunit